MPSSFEHLLLIVFASSTIFNISNKPPEANDIPKTEDAKSVEGGDSTSYSVTSVHQKASAGNNPESNFSATSFSEANEKTESDNHDQANSPHNLNSQKKKEELPNNSNSDENKEQSSYSNGSLNVENHSLEVKSSKSSYSQGHAEEPSNENENANVAKYEQVESTNNESEGKREDAPSSTNKTNQGNHSKTDSLGTHDVKEQTDSETLPNTDKKDGNNKDAVAK